MKASGSVNTFIGFHPTFSALGRVSKLSLLSLNENVRIIILSTLALATLASCEGAFSWVYDEVGDEPQTTLDEIYLDASAWDRWYYIDFDNPRDIVSHPIPKQAVGESVTTMPDASATGQYMYWYDIFGQGLGNNRFEYFFPTAEQAEPERWHIAIHRNNFRTNHGSVWDEATKTWVEDVWTTDQVWDDNSKMMDCYVPSQGIALNPVLAKWLSMYIPPIPPSFTFRPAQYIVKTADGSQFAVELKNYISNEGKKCCFTIKYRKL